MNGNFREMSGYYLVSNNLALAGCEGYTNSN